jgi:N-acetylneuraminic acid mutarotase
LSMTMNIAGVLAAEWRAMPPLPEGMGNFACGTVGADIVLLGGITWRDGVKIWRDSVWRYDAAKEQWSETGKLPHPLAYPAFGQAEDGLFFAGGSDGQATQSGVVRLDSKLQVRKLAALAQPRVYSGCAIAGGKLYVLAGALDATNLTTVTNSFYSIELDSGKTEWLPAYPAPGVMLPATAAIGDRLFAFTGGRVLTETQVQNTASAYVYSLADKTWTPLKPYPLAVRGLAACALDERHILLGGGFKDDFVDDQFVYDTRTGVYVRAQPLPYRAMANYVKAGDALYWLGGEDRMKHRSDRCYRIAWKELLAGPKTSYSGGALP